MFQVNTQPYSYDAMPALCRDGIETHQLPPLQPLLQQEEDSGVSENPRVVAVGVEVARNVQFEEGGVGDAA